MRSSWLEIDLAALQGNVQSIRSHLGPNCGLVAVVKANAYGHGLVPIAQETVAAGAAMLGVALLGEAVQLREAGLMAPILVFGAHLPEEAEAMVEARASPFVSERAFIQSFSNAAVRQGMVTGVHLKVDTGMGRMGVLPEEALDFARLIQSLPSLRLEGVCTHFADSEENRDFTEHQGRLFQAVLSTMHENNIQPEYFHASNSGGVQQWGPTGCNLARPGLLLYGCPPVPEAVPKSQPVLQWKARITQVRTLPAGATVGYGMTARLARNSRIAIVPVGYADGWPRSLSNRGRVLVRGEWARIVGRVSMDQCTVDVSDIPGVELGDEVVLVGGQGSHRQSVDDVAAAAETNIHDILAGLSARLPRVYG